MDELTSEVMREGFRMLEVRKAEETVTLSWFNEQIAMGPVRLNMACLRQIKEIAEALLAARSVLHREFQGFERKVRSLARCDDRAKLLMSAPGVGVLVSLTYASAIDNPGRFKRSKQAGQDRSVGVRQCRR